MSSSSTNIDDELKGYESSLGKKGHERSAVTYAQRVRTLRLDCGASCLRTFTIAANFVFLIIGVALLGGGSYIQANEDVADVIPLLTLGGIILGVFVCVLSFMGCCGAYQESKLLLGVYTALLILLGIALVAMGSFVASKSGSEDDLIETGWDNLGNDLRVTLQDKHGCCGLLEYSVKAGTPCPTNSTESRTDHPCMPSLVDAFSSILSLCGILGLIFGLAVLLGSAASVCLIRGIKKAEEKARMHYT